MKISAVILTKNEEKNIEKCLKSLEFIDEIIVIDDCSSDKTLETVHKVLKVNKVYKVFQRKLNGDFAEQRNFAMTKASNDWVLFVDADETISSHLREEIELKINENAFYIKRKDFFWGKELKYGEVRRMRQMGLIRFMRKGSGRWYGEVHEEFRIKNLELRIGKLKNYINHYPHQSLKEFIEDVNYYSSLRADELYSQGKSVNVFEIVVWPLGKFIYNYFLQLGFLDGVQGFVYAFMMSFHSFLVRAKLYVKKFNTVFLAL